MSNIPLISFQKMGDERGSLISLEQHKNIPFDIKRIYYIFDTQSGLARGFHAHYDLEQVAICMKGCVTFLIDDGTTKETVTLSSPDVGLHIKGLKWREMHDFSEDCVLMVVASELYDEADYIRDYDTFLKEVTHANSCTQ
ncbi:FdtA/QdtA family cupin domain-containing protein [Vibrio parahaemolyticus]|uniref:sugar 3,4-ketoisomerase n=1 Tax=Vibrio parahaemolyticus TaxID=670 RepID=UPI00111E360C|nr:FdtA/QdtA family cupin domain-containing protein [Vibrio parahaemolyticus]TPA50234.1 WxcM-like domain-containing protein [Vibrio parahaemolyticus]HCE1919625.1 WxcM-like domain-containing protein [Vibrio parahaemolyticus]HCM0427488.1 WxcM-like domain-containing protein [Vibrio parahaemolyticus]HCM0453921.1 WxcM-like domain-containing protein [Vibrio parahaemolyticus]HCM0544622.1 WxcM-like domain-containing protein [Vibrio parahaemolyticus]